MSCDSVYQPEFDVIIPAFRAEETLGECLEALLKSGFKPQEVTVVDDGSPDKTGDIARTFGVQVITNSKPSRPARARNKGASGAEGDILVFVDADVLVHEGLRERLIAHFADPEITAVIGSYDDMPAAPSVVSRYRNILHHATHQDAAGEIGTFWSGLGAVRRTAFEASGGFEPDWEDIEDVELGLRLVANGGRIRLDPDMLGKHLKDWTLGSMFRTDLFGRAVPWTRLMQSGRMPFGTLNTSRSHTVSAASVVLAAAAVPFAFFWPTAWWAVAVAVVAFVGSNLRLIQRLARSGGGVFAIQALPYHAIHYVAGLLGFAKVFLLERNTR